MIGLLQQGADRIVLRDDAGEWTAQSLLQRIAQWRVRLGAAAPARPARVASLLDNGIDAVALDLALAADDAVHVPLPTFFHPRQVEHVLQSVGADLLVRPPPAGAGTSILQPLQPARRPLLPAGTGVVTFTSGSTGAPKGVCLSRAHLQRVASSLLAANPIRSDHRHLCLLPLGVLLEQVAGVFAPLLAGARIEMVGMQGSGLLGASGVDGARLADNLRQRAAHSAILLPQMLEALVEAVVAGHDPGPQLRFLAVGGGRVAAASIQRARALGLPVYQGYGLSEAGSVVCLQTSDCATPGAVGRVLAHQQLEIDADGQIWLGEAGHLGYVGDDRPPPRPWPTGDLGRQLPDGSIELLGRLGNRLITSFGRNLSPEWIESELCSHPLILQAFVYGDGQPRPAAVLVPRSPQVGDAELRAAVAQVNQGLPDYARIASLQRAAPFAVADGLLTSNGRLRRDALLARYGTFPDSLTTECS